MVLGFQNLTLESCDLTLWELTVDWTSRDVTVITIRITLIAIDIAIIVIMVRSSCRRVVAVVSGSTISSVARSRRGIEPRRCSASSASSSISCEGAATHYVREKRPNQRLRAKMRTGLGRDPKCPDY